MYNSDNNWTPPYYPSNPNPNDHHHYHPPPPAPPFAPPPPPPPPPSFASAPPYAPPPPSSFPPFPPIPDHADPTATATATTITTPHGVYSSAPPPHLPSPTPSPYDPHQTYPAYPNPNPNLGSGSYGYDASFDHHNNYNNSSKFEYGPGYLDEGYGGGYDGNTQRVNAGPGLGLGLGSESYGKRGEVERYEMGYEGYNGNNHRVNVGPGSEPYGSKRGESERYDMGMYKDEGVYAYEGRTEPYGARGTGGSKGSNWSGLFDDYGRPISFPATSEKKTASSLKVVKAVPKVDTDVDVKSGVQKFRVKLLPESGGSGVMDVLCMVGLDGIRMLDPSTSRTLRIYPLDTVTRCDKIDSSTFAFWSKTSVDVEPRRIRLQSSSYTINTILDTVTAATVQFKEMGGRIRPAESFKSPEQPADKKKGFTDWITKLKPVNEEKDHWVPDEVVTKCTGCGSDFSAFNRRHHCRNCGDIFCDKCTQGRTPLNNDDNAPSVRVCDRCMGEVTRRLTKAKDVVSRPVTLHSHEDLAKKLQEEMEKNLKISGSKSEGSGKQMREVACPTCTVHLQVQVPTSGSETIECGVCQNPFLVSAH